MLFILRNESKIKKENSINEYINNQNSYNESYMYVFKMKQMISLQ